jgi:uncharacterized protein YqeY
MSLFEKIKKDYYRTRLAKETIRINLLSTLIGDLESSAKFVDGKKVVDDQAVIGMIKKYLKNNEIILEAVKRVPGRSPEEVTAQSESIYRTTKEIEVLNSFLPQQLSEQELKDILKTLSQRPDFPNWMKFLKANFAGLYDGKVAAEIFKNA